MSFALDDHNPDNPLPIQNPSDLGFNSWSDFLIDMNSKFDPLTFLDDPIAIQIEKCASAIYILTSMLNAMVLQNA